jgi:hypothetical protein
VLQAFEQVIDADPSRYLGDVEEGEAVRLRRDRSVCGLIAPEDSRSPLQ